MITLAKTRETFLRNRNHDHVVLVYGVNMFAVFAEHFERVETKVTECTQVTLFGNLLNLKFADVWGWFTLNFDFGNVLVRAHVLFS